MKDCTMSKTVSCSEKCEGHGILCDNPNTVVKSRMSYLKELEEKTDNE